MVKIIVLGGGIAGMTVCHELHKYGYDITLIERNDILGGLARTYQNENDKLCPYEYSWRAYGRWYQNVYDIMKRIPFNDPNDSLSNSVFGNVIELKGGKETCFKKIPKYDNFADIPTADYIKLLPLITTYFSQCDQNNIDKFATIGIKQFIKENGISDIGEMHIGKILGPYLGMDYNSASVYDVMYAYEMMSSNESSEYSFSITKYPTNYAWFDPWEKFLLNKNIIIQKNTEVTKIFTRSDLIDSVETYDKITKKYQRIRADYFISCLSPESIFKLMYANTYLKSIDLTTKLYNVSKNGRQIQLSVYYYLDTKLFLSNNTSLAYLPNTPWLLMVLPTGHIWGNAYLKKYCNDSIKEIISVGICQPYNKGLLIKKSWSECTVDEIRQEAWYQLVNDPDFSQNVCIGRKNSKKITDVKILDFKMQPSYKFSDKTKKLDTYEPKWANNINTVQYRPDAVTEINNFFIAGAYTNTSTGLYSMESAVESGKIAAMSLYTLHTGEKSDIYIHIKQKNQWFAMIRYIDQIFYETDITCICLIFIILLCVLYMIYYDSK